MRKTANILLPLALLLPTLAMAAAPLPGNYTSTDIGGNLLVGRYTEGWAAGGGGLLSGATLNCASWDGASLGTQWRYWCGTQVGNSVLLIDTVNAQGNGNRTYASTYVGGHFWLSGTGPWANGDADYPGVMESYVEYETLQYSNWNQIGAITNVQMSAHFDNYPTECMGYDMGNGLRVSDTNLGQPAPANYPQFLDTNCNAGPTTGACWNFFTITLSIVDCSVGTQERTWGAVKSMYGK